MASRIPPLLDAYLGLPPETSLTLLSGILGSNANWLVFRYLCSLLSPPSGPIPREDGPGSSTVDDINVVFVSFLRDYAFWKDGVGKLGIDLDSSTRKGRFVFVDGLSGLFHTLIASPANAPGPQILSSGSLQHLRNKVEDAMTQTGRPSSQGRTVLIIDQPDLLLAASEDAISSQALRETLLDLRDKVYASIFVLSADEPLISSQATSLEKDHAALAISIAHDARLVISLRMLDTGAARDVSGVLRVTPGGGVDDGVEVVEERELLYFVAGDGGVRVFERGE
ncbi:hypothetical protein GGR52DRAFT_544242 [Hypoxylon sp. FL1284]|nr:hypothetical protein GGR52DRAFT_544242 [Hypoxylon sp. FL1284]